MLQKKYNKDKKMIMMIGTEINGKGGIASVLSGYYNSGIMKRQNIDYYQSHCDGERIKKLLFYIKNLLKIILKIY
jgi:hypothetical protein